jgi:hypothetical protein
MVFGKENTKNLENLNKILSNSISIKIQDKIETSAIKLKTHYVNFVNKEINKIRGKETLDRIETKKGPKLMKN